jgi:regulation of enolase protein 1 (concanavalin A-like superfamily)
MKKWNWLLAGGLILASLSLNEVFAASGPYASAGILQGPQGWEISVSYSALADDSDALAASHYSLSQGELGFPVRVEQDGVVLLPASGLDPGKSYTLSIQGLSDTNGNSLPKLDLSLQTAPISWSVIGGNELGLDSGATAIGSAGFDLISGGIQFFGRYDEGTFVYEQVTGDFDRAIRVAGQDATSRYARAGLMARETLDAGKPRPTDPFDPLQAFSRYLDVHVNPAESADGSAGNNTHEISFRPYTGGIGSDDPDATVFIPISNNAAPAYPNAWLRMKREGQLFRMFRSNDGQNWIEIGSATFPTKDFEGNDVPPFPATAYIGAIYCPENGSISASSGLRQSFMAQFRDYTISGAVAPRLVIHQTSPTEVEISWSGGGALQSADSLAAIEWKDVANGSSPFKVSSAGTKFYRVRQ